MRPYHCASMILKSGYLALALKLQEAVTKEPDKFKAKLDAALLAETEDGPWKSFLEAGARHSASDMGHLQAIHDASAVLGASCSGGEMAESATPTTTGLRLIESAATLEPIVLREAKADYEIKLIAPGPGAMAYYPADVLKRDGPSAFPIETKIYANHPPKSASVSESTGNRDVYRFAGVLTTPAEYKESHAKGPGLYARMKVFADHGQFFEDKGKYLGMSIMANGQQAVESGKPAMRDGLPVLGKITSGESVDVVSIAGAGGMILTEAARTANPTEEAAEMTAEDVTKLVEAGIRKARLPEEAQFEATRLLESLQMKPSTKQVIVEGVLRQTIPVKEGALDKEAFGLLVVAEAQRIGRIVAEETGGGRVFGMGIGAPVPAAPKPEEIAAREAQAKRDEAESVEVWKRLGLNEAGAKAAANGRAA